MYIFKTGINENIHDEFVKASPYCNLLQSSSWAKIKGNWSHEIVGVYENEQLVASSLPTALADFFRSSSSATGIMKT